jgi:signal transduction histidine kinase
MVLTHSQPDYYSLQSRTLSQAYANQVAIAIHNAQLYKQAGNNAALEERNRLARELHDSVAQALFSISLFIDAARMALHTNKPEVVDEHLQELTQLAREAMADMRLMIFELRPPDLEKVGLAGFLQKRIESVEARSGFQASFEAEGEIHLPLEQEAELYRIAQEALNNIAKHAQASRVLVRLTREGNCVRMSIEDDGVGFDPSKIEQKGGHGFTNMQERAAMIGASFTFETGPGQGMKIWIELKQ